MIIFPKPSFAFLSGRAGLDYKSPNKTLNIIYSALVERPSMPNAKKQRADNCRHFVVPTLTRIGTAYGEDHAWGHVLAVALQESNVLAARA